MNLKQNTDYEKEYLPGFSPLKIGTELCRKYVIGKVLGNGGFGIVYLAQELASGRTVAVKEYFPCGMAVRNEDGLTVETLAYSQANDFDSGRTRFRAEAELLMEIACIGIPEIYDCFPENGTEYYVMEYVSGINMRSYVESRGRLSEEETVHILSELAEILRVMHANNILHRDISPENIMICSSGIKLLDFSAARYFDSTEDSNMTVILKQGFAPPEQYRRKAAVSPATDIYSLGASAFFALSGTTPDDSFSRQDGDEKFIEVSESFSEPLRKIIRKASAVNIEERYGNADELLSDLRICGIPPREIPSADEPVRLPKKTKRGISRKLISAVIIIAAVGGIGAGIGMYFGLGADSAGDKYAEEIPQEIRIGDEYFNIDSTELDLSGRELTNTQITKLKHFKKLKKLNLKDNYLTDLSVLSELTQLESLHFSHNNVSDISFIEGMSGLRKLSAENNSIEDISSLSGKTELVEVFLGDNFITDISPLKDCSKLEEVSFNESQIGSIDALTGKTNLTKVCLAGCNLTDISPLEGCSKLRYVYLGRNCVMDFSPLRSCVEIEELYLDNNGITADNIESLYGINLVGFMAIEGNGLTEMQINELSCNIIGGGTIYY